ncbi:HalD/BesD family halogenase, partial [Streptomyces sp. NPDC054878]
ERRQHWPLCALCPTVTGSLAGFRGRQWIGDQLDQCPLEYRVVPQGRGGKSRPVPGGAAFVGAGREGTAVLVLTLPSQTAALAARFAKSGYLPLPGLLTRTGLTTLQEECDRLEVGARRRDFRMACMDNSPRHMTTLGGQHIAQESALITGLYRNAGLLAFLAALHRAEVTTVAEPVERHVLNILHRPGDTHGAHTDDYPLALVLFLQAPPRADDGGLLEFSPGRHDLKALKEPGTCQLHHPPGDAYLLRSDLTAHRVTPLTRPGRRRTVLNFAYTTPDRQQPTTKTAHHLYT